MRARLWCLRHARCPPMVPAATTYVLRINRLQMECRRRAEPVQPRHRARARRLPAPPPAAALIITTMGTRRRRQGAAPPPKAAPATRCSHVPEPAARPDRPVGRPPAPARFGRGIETEKA